MRTRVDLCSVSLGVNKPQGSESYIVEIEGISIILHVRDLFSMFDVNLLWTEGLFHSVFYEMYNNSVFRWFVTLLFVIMISYAEMMS